MAEAGGVEIVREITDFPARLRGGAVAIGNFDGVHRGHARLIAQLKDLAESLGGPTVVFTFDPHPVRLLRPAAAPPPLTWTERKAALLAGLGVDVVVAYRTDDELLALGPWDFFEQIVRGTLGARALVEGPNFHFGRNREGSVSLLQQYCDQVGIRLEVVAPMICGGQYVSSSGVRELIREGNVTEANRLLTRPYRIRGLVTHGDARGTKIGFPTANLNGIDTLLPAAGIYAGRGTTGGSSWPAAIHIGPIPTFGIQTVKVEVHLIGFHGALYGAILEVDFRERLRDIHPFASVEELKRQLALDVAAAAESDARHASSAACEP